MALTKLVQVSAAGLVLLGTAMTPAPLRPSTPAPPPASRPAPAPAGAPARPPDPGRSYMPLVAGRTLSYRSNAGEPFTLAFGKPFSLAWFDGTRRQVVPMHDSRCGCDFLLQNADGEIRAVGMVTDGQTSQWGEYIQILPRGAGGTAESVQTPAGRFDEATLVMTEAGPVWFAPGIGMLKTDEFVLTGVSDTGP